MRSFAMIGLFLGLCLACAGGEDKEPTTETAVDSAPVDEGPVLTGCQRAENWTCEEPSPGYEYSCVATCGQEWVMTCNQQYEGGQCRINPYGGSSVEICDVPQGSGCEICYEAAGSTCADLVD